jgi:peptidoglycan/xylan/chitin deacetylase (PgdA/CDA1 family)
MKWYLIILLFCSIWLSPGLNAQQTKEWNGKQCTVVFTYDDALNVHLDNVITSLDTFGLKGTFYITGEALSVSKRMNEWRKAAQNGHELGNHSLTHPCDGNKTGRSWVTEEKDLSRYSVARAVNEIKITSTLLQAIDGKTERSFAYPCGDKMIDTVNFYKYVEADFTGARGVQSGLKRLNEIDLNNINCYSINQQAGDYMINLVKQAMESRTLLVFLFHGVGGEHNLNVSLEAHRQLLQFVKQHEKEIWNAPLVEVAKYVKANRGKR